MPMITIGNVLNQIQTGMTDRRSFWASLVRATPLSSFGNSPVERLDTQEG
jgi:hypothetical protein